MIIEESYDPIFGARPMKRYLQSKVETLIARAILSGGLREGDTVCIDVQDGGLAVV
jgi:ATP-dependent Clp protease ATP-binding subunit ClpB